MEDVKKLLSDLHSKAPELRNSATMALWEFWYFEAGEVAETYIRKGEDLMSLNKNEEAQSQFEKVTDQCLFFVFQNHPPVNSTSRLTQLFKAFKITPG